MWNDRIPVGLMLHFSEVQKCFSAEKLLITCLFTTDFAVFAYQKSVSSTVLPSCGVLSFFLRFSASRHEKINKRKVPDFQLTADGKIIIPDDDNHGPMDDTRSLSSGMSGLSLKRKKVNSGILRKPLLMTNRRETFTRVLRLCSLMLSQHHLRVF